METRLRPRTSFARWKQEVRGRCAPWRDFEVDAVRGLRRALIEIIVEKPKSRPASTSELQQSNIELDSFAYVASHDLKEPLRGIHNYSAFLQRTAGERLTEGEAAASKPSSA